MNDMALFYLSFFFFLIWSLKSYRISFRIKLN